MPDNASRRGAVDMGMPLMLLAFVVIGGFMFWLNGQAQAEKAMRVVEEAPEEEMAAPTVETVAIGDIEVDPGPYVGTKLRTEGAVASMLGTQGFWVATPSGNPFLISWNDALLAEGRTVAMGDTVAVEGDVMEMQELTLVNWTTNGTISDTDRIIAEFATHYINAERVDVTGSAGAGDAEGSTEGN